MYKPPQRIKYKIRSRQVFVPVAAIRDAIRQAGFSIPLVIAGGIHGFEQAEELLKMGKADIIGAARQSLADPDWFLKLSRDGKRRLIAPNWKP